MTADIEWLEAPGTMRRLFFLWSYRSQSRFATSRSRDCNCVAQDLKRSLSWCSQCHILKPRHENLLKFLYVWRHSLPFWWHNDLHRVSLTKERLSIDVSRVGRYPPSWRIAGKGKQVLQLRGGSVKAQVIRFNAYVKLRNCCRRPLLSRMDPSC